MNLSSSIEQILGPTLRPASVRMNRQIGAAPGRIFDAWLDAGAARTWLFGGRGEHAVTEVDPRLGGRFRWVRRWDGEEVEYCGEYLEIERPCRLVFSLFVERYGQRDDRVIVEIAPLAERSLLVLTHELSLANPADRSRIQRDWTLSLDALVAWCAPLGTLRAPSSAQRCALPVSGSSADG